jgi:hypothetical protein
MQNRFLKEDVSDKGYATELGAHIAELPRFFRNYNHVGPDTVYFTIYSPLCILFKLHL